MKKLILVTLLLLAVAISTASATPVLDNANGGTWREYIHIPLAAPITENAQYKIVINGTTVSVYNSTGYLKVSGTVPSFWNYVNASGADIRVANQTSELYFWIQSFNATTKQAAIWVNLTAGSSELDIFYGNPVASPSVYNNITKTFRSASSFEQNTYPFTPVGTIYYSTIAHTGKYSLEAKYTGTLNGFSYTLTLPSKFEVLEYIYLEGATNAHIISFRTATGYVGPHIAISETGGTTSSTEIYFFNGAWVATGYYLTTNTWHEVKCVINTATQRFDLYVDGNKVVSGGTYIAAMPTGTTASFQADIGNTAATAAPILFDDVAMITPLDPATFGTPVQETAGRPTPGTIFINATYNAYDITGHLLINNSTTLLTPAFSYKPSTASSTGYLGTGSITVPGLANITIYLDSNYALNSVVCNGTAVTPNYLGTTTLNGINFSVYNFTSPSAGLLVVTANVTPVTSGGTVPSILLGAAPTLNITSDISLINVNATYGATIKVSVEQPLNLSYLIYNGTELAIPTPTTVTINGKNYSQYTITVYNSSALHVVATTPNLALATKTYADGDTNFSCVLVGEPFKVVTPVPCNVTLEGVTHTDTSTITYTPMAPHPIIGAVEIFNLTTLQFGYYTFDYPVVWGHVNLTVTPPVPVTPGVYSLTYAKVCGLNTLYAGNDKITVYYMGMPVGQATFYLNHTNNGMNVTIPINATSVSSRCYNMTAVSPAKFKIYNLSSIPYGKFAVDHTQEVIITFENNSPVTVSVTGSTYAYYPPHLYIYGSGNATVTSYYKIKMNAESAVGLPMNISVTVNGKKMYVYGMTTKVMPVDRYEIHFPANVLGFVLKNSTLTNTTVVLTNSTSLPTAVYKVPTHISLEAYKINTTSFRFPFLPIPIPLGKVSTKQTNGTIACVEGTLYSWYGVPVPNANVTVHITSLKTGYTITRVVNTGSTGTFSVNFSVLPGVNYSISASFNGTPVYIGSEKKIVVAGGTLPPAPTVEHKTSAVLIAGAITVVSVSILAAAYMIHRRSTVRAVRRLERRGKYFGRRR